MPLALTQYLLGRPAAFFVCHPLFVLPIVVSFVFQSSVSLLQTAPSGANIGVRSSVRIKKVHINVGNNKFLTNIVQLKSGLKSEILLIDE